jgi:hypothetical protein
MKATKGARKKARRCPFAPVLSGQIDHCLEQLDAALAAEADATAVVKAWRRVLRGLEKRIP